MFESMCACECAVSTCVSVSVAHSVAQHCLLYITPRILHILPLTPHRQALSENRTVSQSRVLLYNEVEKVYKDELAIREKALGRDHMSMIAICHYLAQVRPPISVCVLRLCVRVSVRRLCVCARAAALRFAARVIAHRDRSLAYPSPALLFAGALPGR